MRRPGSSAVPGSFYVAHIFLLVMFIRPKLSYTVDEPSIIRCTNDEMRGR